ncbi:hypothetical protein D3C86_1278970 [compost metagenome]
MEGITVHKLNEKLVVSIYPLPGFRSMGSCVIRDGEGNKTGEVDIHYAGVFFKEHPGEEFEKVRKAVLKLAQNYAVKTRLGVASTRLNLTVALRDNMKKLARQNVLA